MLHYDNETEYVIQNFSKFLKDNGFIHELLCANIPQHNVLQKGKNMIFLRLALLFQMFVPKS